MIKIITLILLLELKHIVADYYLQSYYIGAGKRLLEGWILPLSIHAFHHGSITFIIILIWTRNFYYSFLVAIFDFSTHFLIDRIKSSPNLLGIYSQNNYLIFTTVDQLLHHLVIWLIVIDIHNKIIYQKYI